VLLRYLKPIGIGSANDNGGNGELQKKLRTNFVKNNQDVHKRITEAVNAGDTKLAHRLAHTLKGNAGLIGKADLRNAADEVEFLLKEGVASIWDMKMNILETELILVLNELSPLLADADADDNIELLDGVEPLDDNQINELFTKLKPMLEEMNAESLTLLDDIRAVPGSKELVKRIEDYDFSTAYDLLDELWKRT
jgi:HPt (histidine-containing phosphotransfer) domain-containing protein